MMVVTRDVRVVTRDMRVVPNANYGSVIY
jgi:hypothetical protein